jgi:hypothetical protein
MCCCFFMQTCNRVTGEVGLWQACALGNEPRTPDWKNFCSENTREWNEDRRYVEEVCEEWSAGVSVEVTEQVFFLRLLHYYYYHYYYYYYYNKYTYFNFLTSYW